MQALINLGLSKQNVIDDVLSFIRGEEAGKLYQKYMGQIEEQNEHKIKHVLTLVKFCKYSLVKYFDADAAVTEEFEELEEEKGLLDQVEQMQSTISYIDYDYLAGLLYGDRLINFSAVYTVLSAYFKELTAAEAQLEVCQDYFKDKGPHKILLKLIIQLGEIFPILYGAMRDDPNNIIYKNPQTIREDLKILFDHLVFSNMGDNDDYFKKLSEGNKGNSQMMGAVFRGMEEESLPKAVVKSLIWAAIYKFKDQDGEIHGSLQMSYLNRDTFKRILKIEQTSIAKTMSRYGLPKGVFDKKIFVKISKADELSIKNIQNTT